MSKVILQFSKLSVGPVFVEENEFSLIHQQTTLLSLANQSISQPCRKNLCTASSDLSRAIRHAKRFMTKHIFCGLPIKINIAVV